MVRPLTHCRVCWSSLPTPYLSLGLQPLANAFRQPDDTGTEFVAPLAVALCPQCGLSQLTVVVSPDLLYQESYPFESGRSPAWHDHCVALVQQLGVPGFVVDIAANDGTLLTHCASAGWEVLGVDPAGQSDTVPIRREFWSKAVAKSIVRDHGRANVIVAQNVFGHVSDPVEFLIAVRDAMADDGRCVIEVPDAYDLMGLVAFDTIYHEHLSYWTMRAMYACAAFANLHVAQVDWLPHLHGGSRRYWMAKGGEGPIFVGEPPDAAVFEEFALAVDKRLDAIQLRLNATEGKVLGAIGASAKGNVMLNALRARGQSVWPHVIVDDAPRKQGTVTPGTRIPVVEPAKGVLESWDYCWVLSWNWADRLKQRATDLGFTGEFLEV